MDKQPSEAARNAMHAALVEHDALDLNPRYPTARGVLRIDPLVTILADYAERYAAEQVQAARTDALEQACQAVCWMCRQGHAHDPNAPTYHRYKDGVHEYVRMCQAHDIRALMSETTKETTNE